MFPPVDDSVLKANPDFAILYGKLTNVVLDSDGSTKEDPAAKERKRVKEVSCPVRGLEFDANDLERSSINIVYERRNNTSSPALSPQSHRPKQPNPLALASHEPNSPPCRNLSSIFCSSCLLFSTRRAPHCPRSPQLSSSQILP